MVGPQAEPFVKFPKQLFDALLRAPLSATQREVVLAVVRLTYGDRLRSQAEVSIGALEKATGRDRHGLKRALERLIGEGVLIELKPAGFSRGRTLALATNYEAWGRFSVAPDEVPAFLRHDWQGQEPPHQGEQGHQGEQHPQGDQGQCNRGTSVNPPGGREPMQQGDQGQPTKDKTRADKDKSSSPKPSRVAARSADEWEQERVRLEQQSQFPEELAELARLLAESNKSDRVATSRVVRELHEPLLALEAKLSTEALAQGLQTAIARSVPNATYVRKVAENQERRGSGRHAAGHSSCGHSDYDRDFLTG